MGFHGALHGILRLERRSCCPSFVPNSGVYVDELRAFISSLSSLYQVYQGFRTVLPQAERAKELKEKETELVTVRREKARDCRHTTV